MNISNGAQSRQIVCILSIFALLLSAQRLVNCQPIPRSPTETLKWSMTKYAELTMFQANCSWSAAYGDIPGGAVTQRTIWYTKPKCFKVVSSQYNGKIVQTSVSDGTKLVEYGIGLNRLAQSYAAPPSIADAATMQMNHPMACGSLLYMFFGGPDRYTTLVDEVKMPVMFGPVVKLDGQECKTIKFWAKARYMGRRRSLSE